MYVAKSFTAVATTEASLLNLDILQQLLPSFVWVDTASILQFQIFLTCECSFY